MSDVYDAVWPIHPGSPSISGLSRTSRRVLTGLHSLDSALAGADGTPGLPIRTGVEIYGRWETGKSTLAYYLAGRVAHDGRIVLVDLEGGSRDEYLRSAVGQSGFSGTVHTVPAEERGNPRTHETMLKEGANALLEEGVTCVILDSAAMVQPVMEREGDMDEAFMGRRAQTLAKFTRRYVSWLNSVEEDKLVIVVNHQLFDLQGYGKISPGGDSLKFGIGARLWITRSETIENAEGAFEAELQVDKLRFGGRPAPKEKKEQVSRVVIIPGIGVSPELTALFDAMAVRDKTYAKRAAGIVSYRLNESDDWEKVGKLVDVVARVKSGDRSGFEPFYDILKEHGDE